MKQQWIYEDPVFEADKYDEIILKYSPWSGHRRFAYDLVSYYEPEMIVELGSFYGCSAFAFMQAVKDQKLRTQICAVDLWEAEDVFTLQDYEQNIYGFFLKVKTEVFHDIDAEMLKMSFDQANSRFAEKSIDILHIDGSHAYEDVKHDFELWIPKMKQDGMVLFHDISEQKLYGKTTGSSIFWLELKESYAYTMEMQHSWGLGILFLTKEKYDDFQKNVNIQYYQKLVLYEMEDCKDLIRKNYFKLKDADKWIDGLKKDKQEAEADNVRLVRELSLQKQAYEKTVQGKEVYIGQLQDAICSWEKETEKIRRDYEDTIQGKDAYIQECMGRLQDVTTSWEKEMKKIRDDYEDTIQGKDAYIQECMAQVQNVTANWEKETEKIRRAYEDTIQGKDAYIQELLQRLQESQKLVWKN